MPSDGVLICDNCKEALRYISFIEANDQYAIYGIERVEEYKLKVPHLFKNCPGDPWCELPEARKTRSFD